jgi:NAD(P)-dependent dehydrogenase (short-subunit alcohol dehydrogenase family)
MNYYENKRVLITGGASGIGRLLALKIAAAGARTAICDIDSTAMEQVRSEAAAKGLSILCFPVDPGWSGKDPTGRRGYPGQQCRHRFRQTISGMQRQ